MIYYPKCWFAKIAIHMNYLLIETQIGSANNEK